MLPVLLNVTLFRFPSGATNTLVGATGRVGHAPGAGQSVAHVFFPGWNMLRSMFHSPTDRERERDAVEEAPRGCMLSSGVAVAALWLGVVCGNGTENG